MTTVKPSTPAHSAADQAAAVRSRDALMTALGSRSIVLVGMMGAGKSSIGRRLADRLGIPFVDVDTEIERGAGMTIAEYFDKYGERDFRSGEVRVISRLLDQGPPVLATGGGAFLHPDTRAGIRRKAVSVWLRAELEVLLRRVRRRTDRPLLKTEDLAATLSRLKCERDPVYAEADLSIHSREVPHETIVDEIIAALATHLGHRDPGDASDQQPQSAS
jgi:shikimate kinase